MNKINLSSRVLFCFFINMILSVGISSSKPITIPALKEWHDTSGEYKLTPTTRIVTDSIFSTLLINEAATFQQDMKTLKGYELQIISSSEPQPGDIFLTMNSIDTLIGTEGYLLSITDKIIIDSRTYTGVFYGTRTLLQLFKNSDTIKSGSARDWSDYKERGLMVDVGRKHFTVEWIKNHIKELSYLKLNYLHLHFSDNEGFTLECDNYPEIMSEKFYTKTEINELQILTEKYHITLVPEIDMPGHMASILTKFKPNLAIKDTNGVINYSIIDVTLNESRIFIKNLLEEYLPLFKGPFWHIGADEAIIDDFNKYPQLEQYAKKHFGENAKPKDAIFDFINFADSIVKSHGKQSRIWNDYLTHDLENKSTLKLKSNFNIDFWQCNLQPINQTQELLDSGYSLNNCSIDCLYYILGLGWRWQNQFLFDTWEPTRFQYNRIIDKNHKGMLGSKLHVWCDYPKSETEEHIMTRIHSALRIFAQKNWGSEKLVNSLKDFENIIDLIGLSPGIIMPENPMPGNIAFHKPVTVSSSENPDLNPESAVDGSYDARWSSAKSDFEWIYVDLGKKYDINRIKLFWADAYALNYQIQTSDDAINWLPIYTTETGAPWITDTSGLTAYGRYVRIYCTKRISENVGYSLWEMEVYGTLSTSLPNDSLICTNSELNFYPNPAEENLNIILDHSVLPVNLKIYDIKGNYVFGQSLINQFNSVDISKLAKGVYLISVNDKKGVLIKK